MAFGHMDRQAVLAKRQNQHHYHQQQDGTPTPTSATTSTTLTALTTPTLTHAVAHTDKAAAAAGLLGVGGLANPHRPQSVGVAF
ncbi:hypothetical protein SPI_06975 [Niveomyces insectorum RCEF 264]|uniref:Uncharacterized protein n=1 Tax=Niveomyces insectorum RCEF 264 TaxID=1081102 RepID=A0A167QY63_9HYPO|nr:hypothetical protein SPI_06975 [Niveomyces insectorum RCEF 264]